jgi:hypothetical protein
MLVRWIALWAAFLALVAAIAATLHPRPGAASFSRTHPFAVLAPGAPPGWEVRDTPLGATELSAGEAARTLYFDDFFYRTYTKGEMEVRVYAAYWAPGRLDPALVAGHSPDVCWVGAGAAMVERDDSRVLPGFANRALRPASFRIFEFSHGREEVVFWHSFGGKPIRFADFSDQTTAPLLGRLRRFTQTLSLTAFGLAPQEQIFVRISTNRTIDELVRSDLWPRLTSLLLQCGIVEKAG